MLNVVDVWSKYAWSIPLKDKTAITTLNAFKEIVASSKRIPKHIWVDQGKEFYNKSMDLWLNENNIVRYSTYGEHKSSVVERFNRTLKTVMWKRFSAENTRNWIDMLDKLMLQYNNKFHSTIKMTPTEASRHSTIETPVELPVLPFEIIQKLPKFKVKDKVRISRVKGLFEKGYLPNWSEEIFRIEKVLRKKLINGIQHGLVKCLGYNQKFNEWLPMSEINNLQ